MSSTPDADSSHECRLCGTPTTLIDGVWVSTDYTTTAGGLSYCPPDPDADRVGSHLPRRRSPNTDAAGEERL